MLKKESILALGACCVAAMNGATAQATEIELRIALPMEVEPQSTGDKCLTKEQITDQGAHDYIAQLQSRFKEAVKLCPVSSLEVAGQYIADGTANLAWTSPEGFEPIRSNARPFMTLRPVTGIGRTQVVVFTKADDDAENMSSLSGADVVLLGQNPVALNHDLVKTVISDHGGRLDEINFLSAPTTPVIVEQVRAAEVDAGAIEVSAWARFCNLLDKQSTICDDLKVLVRSYPRATEAMVISNDLPHEFRYRMLSVHAMMHFEAPNAFHWVSKGQGNEFEPTEAGAFHTTTGTGY